MFWDKLGVIGDAFAKVIGSVDSLIDNVHTSVEEKMELKNLRTQIINDRIQIEADLKIAGMQHELEMEKQAVEVDKIKASIILAEATGKSAAQRNWRPHAMYVFMAAILNDTIIAPYLFAIFNWGVPTPLPALAWALFTTAMSGYIGARSYEKGGLMKTISNVAGTTDIIEKARVAIKRPEPIPPRPLDLDVSD